MTPRRLLIASLLWLLPIVSWGQGGNFPGPRSVVTLDVGSFAGGDLGAKMNNCDAALPSTGGICNAANLTGPQTISTAVVTTKATVFNFCGQAITQTAAITLAVSNSSLIGCPDWHTIITKAANINQVSTSSTTNNTISYIDFEGAKASFTGNGIVVNGGTWVYIDHNIINGEAGNDIDNEAGTWVFESNNELTGWGTRAIFMNGSVDYASDNYINGDTTATNNAITCTACESTISHSWIQDSSAAHLITQSGGNPLVLTSNTMQEFGGFSAVNGAVVSMSNNVVFGGGASGDAVQVTGTSNISGNTINGQSGGNGVTLTGSNISVVANNTISLTATTSKNGILITGDTFGNAITGNSINITDGGAASPHNNGIQMLTVSGHMFLHTLDNNTINGTASVDGVWYNNNANLNTVANENRVTFTSCFNTATCIKRTDTQNNTNFYAQNTSNGTIYASGGSTNDIIEQTITTTAFASLPTAGNGSLVLCSDCTQGIAAASGAGGLLTRTQGAWLNGLSATTPSVASGFGSGAAVVAGGIPSAFRLGVGTTSGNTGVITLPAAKTGWNCSATDITTNSTTVFVTKQTASTATSATIGNFSDVAGAGPWTNSDVLAVSCFPF